MAIFTLTETMDAIASFEQLYEDGKITMSELAGRVSAIHSVSFDYRLGNFLWIVSLPDSQKVEFVQFSFHRIAPKFDSTD